MSEIKLRPYQQKFIDDVREQFQLGHKRVCGVAPCGSGKTIMTGWMTRETAQNGKRVLFMVHRKELIDQTSKTFTDLGIEHGIIASGVKSNYDLPVQIASVQTLVKRIKDIPRPDLLICDECHHILADSYMKILNYWKPYLLGVTATPLRLGGITLHDVFDAMVMGPSVGTLIQYGNLTNFKYFAPDSDIDYSKLRSKFGEYVTSDMVKVMDRQPIIGSAIDSYKQHANGKQAIVYCVNVRHSKHTAQLFTQAGIKAAHVDGETSKARRQNIIESFRRGDITVLCNAELFGEGFDVPNCECIILLRPTQSLTLYIQQAMRGMRPDDKEKNQNKVAIIIDHVENIKRFGLPDEDRQWSLDPNKVKNFMESAPVKKCPECDEVLHAAVKVCPDCGHDFEIPDYIEEDGTVQQCEDTRFKDYSTERNDNVVITTPTLLDLINRYMTEAKSKDYKKVWVYYKVVDFAETLEDFKLIARCLEYKEGWAWYRWRDKMQSMKNNIMQHGLPIKSNNLLYL